MIRVVDSGEESTRSGKSIEKLEVVQKVGKKEIELETINKTGG